MEFKVYQKELELQSRGWIPTFHDVTKEVGNIVTMSGVKNGTVCVASHHTTCSVITQECAFDMSMTGLETLQQDLVNVFEKWIPTCRCEGMYLHPGKKALDFARKNGLSMIQQVYTNAKLKKNPNSLDKPKAESQEKVPEAVRKYQEKLKRLEEEKARLAKEQAKGKKKK